MSAPKRASGNGQPDNSRYYRRLSLIEVPVGMLVEFETESGSLFWVVKLSRHNMEGDKIKGLSITTNSKSILGFNRSPATILGSAIIEVGERWQFGYGASTTEVVSINVKP